MNYGYYPNYSGAQTTLPVQGTWVWVPDSKEKKPLQAKSAETATTTATAYEPGAKIPPTLAVGTPKPP